MLDDDDNLPRKPQLRLQRLVLDSLGIAELRAYIEELRAEIGRVEEEIARKSSHRTSADAIFRRQPG
jgi:uncharacterized small protein (DUF1192 family)